MQSEIQGQASAHEWGRGAHRNARDLAAMLGIPLEQFDADPLSILPALENYVSRLPLHEFEESDWITLHTDLTSFLGDTLVRRHSAWWAKASDSNCPTGCRYFIEAAGIDNRTHRVEPYDVVLEEFQHLPVEVTRLLSTAETVLGLSPEPAAQNRD